MKDNSSGHQLDRPPKALRSDDAQLDPYSWYREMRDENPVRYDPDRGVWDVFRYDDVKRILRDYELFSSAVDSHLENDQGDSPPAEASGSEQESASDTLVMTDPPKHDRIRSVVSEHFQADAIQSYRPRVEAIAADLVNDLEPGEVDIIDTFAYPLPVDVIASVLGVPREERAMFKRWSDAVVDVPSKPGDRDGPTREEARVQMSEYFGELLAKRWENPRNDLLTAIATAGDGESELSDQEMVSLCILLLLAGNVTTTNLLPNAFWSFHEHGVLNDVQDGSVPLGPAIEEALRYRSPVQKVDRVARQDVKLGGKTIEMGDPIVVWLGAANRDGRHFDAPDAFDPTRRPNDHLAFGQGIHYCLGAPLARLEADVGLTALFDRFEMTDVNTADLSPSPGEFYGLEELVVTLE